MADKDNDEVELTIADEAVVTKYKTAGEIANSKYIYRSRIVLVRQTWHPSRIALDRFSVGRRINHLSRLVIYVIIHVGITQFRR